MSAIGGYEIVGELGRGAMGIVYKAVDKTLSRNVALKILPAHLKQHPHLVERFKREAMVAASLNHPNMVTVYAIGEDSGHYFIAMEFVNGKNLAELLKEKGKLDIGFAVGLAKQAALALSKAHPQGIIHRDIKPANLLINEDNLLKVADFGLARLAEGNSDLTNAKDNLGTPRYMAPELFEGKPASAISDTYALGITLYELLSGRPSFRASSPAALMHAILNSPLDRISELRPGVPPDLERIIMKATNKDPKMRFITALELFNALEEWEQTGTEVDEVGGYDSIPRLPSGGGVSDMAPTEFIPAMPDNSSIPQPPDESSGGSSFAGSTPNFMQEAMEAAALDAATPAPGNVDGISQPTPPPTPKDEVDFYIHYVPNDEQWADWIYHLLSGVGYNAVKFPWDTVDPHEALRQLIKKCRQGSKSIALASPAYMNTIHGSTEWITSLFNRHWEPFPVMVLNCVNMAATFGTTNYLDLVKQTREQARVLLLEECEELRGKPRNKSAFTRIKRRKKAEAPKLKDAIWSVPWSPEGHFVGRSAILEQMHQRLNRQGGIMALVSKSPTGNGVGRSQLAIEYANLHKSEFSIVFWVRGSSRVSIQEDLGELVDRIGLEEKSSSKITIKILALKKWLELNTGWLLIFDDVRNWRALMEFLPKEPAGQILCTSSSNDFPAETNPMALPPLERQESVELLFRGTKIRSEGAAAALAASLGDTPTAIHLAIAYMNNLKVGYDEYYDQFINAHRKMWGVSNPALDPEYVIRTAVLVALKRVRDEEPLALDLLKVIAYLGDGPFPVSYIVSGTKPFPRSLRKALQNARKFGELFSILKKFNIILYESERVCVHSAVKNSIRLWLETDMMSDKSAALEEGITLLRPNRWEQKDPTAWADLMGQFYEELLPDNDAVTDIENSGWLVTHISDYLRAASAIKTDPSMTSSLWLYVSIYLWLTADFVRAASACRRAIQERVKAVGPHHKKVAEMYLHSGNIYRAQGDNKQARQEYEHALEIQEKARGKNQEEMGKTLQQIGNISMDMSDYSAARRSYRQALEINRKVHGEHSEEVCRDYTNLGLVAQELEDLTEAWDQYSTGLEIAEKVLDEYHPMKAYVVKNMAGLLLRMGDQMNAKNYYQRAIQIDSALHGKEHPYVAQSYNNLGLIMQNLGDIEAAYNHFANALEINEAVYGRQHPKVAINLLNVGNLLNMKGDLENAEKYFKRATMIFRERFGENHAHTQSAMNNWRNARARMQGSAKKQ